MPAGFRTTRWTLIAAVGVGDERGREALAELCDAYWRPVYNFVRRQGYPPEQAADLTQGAFAHLLAQRGFECADPARGRFRSYLLAAVRHYLISEHARDAAQRRGRGAVHQSIDVVDAEPRFALEAPALHASPEAAFERQWAVTTTERAMARLADDYAARGQRALFDQLLPQLTSDGVGPTNGDRDAASGHVDPKWSAMSDEARRAALSRLRRRFATALRAEIGETVVDPRDVDDELRQLLRALAAA
jgi:RNA polymerase sigma factor (sigma-70 family)